MTVPTFFSPTWHMYFVVRVPFVFYVQVQTWVKFSVTELKQFARKFEEEEERELDKIRKKYVVLTQRKCACVYVCVDLNLSTVCGQ